MKRYFKATTYDERDITFTADVPGDTKLKANDLYRLAIEADELPVDDVDNVDSVEEITEEEYNTVLV